MWALKSCAAAGARTKPITRLVTMARGTLTTGARLVLKRISEKIGASATPKNAVLMCVAKVSFLKRAYSLNWSRGGNNRNTAKQLVDNNTDFRKRFYCSHDLVFQTMGKIDGKNKIRILPAKDLLSYSKGISHRAIPVARLDLPHSG